MGTEESPRMIPCPQCRRENIYLDIKDSPVAAPGTNYRLGSYSIWNGLREDQNPFWLSLGFTYWAFRIWYCHLCDYKLRYPKSWIVI